MGLLNQPTVRPPENLAIYRTLRELRTMSDAIVNVSNTPDGYKKSAHIQQLKRDRDVLKQKLPPLRIVT